MVVLIVESAPASLRGELSKWMLEPKAGVFVGTLSATVRDLLWDKACREVSEGGAMLIHRINNEQGFTIRTFGDPSRQIEEWEGLFLVRRPNAPEPKQADSDVAVAPDWQAMCHPAVWAKTARGVTLADGEPNWHPLICHMIDVAMVTSRLWRYVLPTAIKEQIRNGLGVGTITEAGRWVAYLTGLHDLGKASPGFALRWPEGAARLMDQGLRQARTRDTSPHGFVTTYLFREILPSMGFSLKAAAAIGFAVGGHHGIFPGPLDMERMQDKLGSSRWREVQRHLAAVLSHALGVEDLSVPQGSAHDDNALLILLGGLTSVADWIGSNHQYFPFVGDQVQVPQYWRRSRWLAMRALIDMGWLNKPEAVESRAFAELFDFPPNRLQEQLEEVAEQLHGPSLVLLEYPMGGGKTEGALYLAHHLQSTSGQQGLYVALPTMATSNQMFDRVTAYLANRFPETRVNVHLLHGRADLNPHYARLLNRGAGLPDPPVIEDERNEDAGLLAAEWFTHRKQGLLAPFGIGTVDQAMLAALDSKHYFVRLFGLAGKVVVLDEVHSYDVYMGSVLARLLSWLGACGASVILLSATLPGRKRRELLAAFGEGRGQSVPADRLDPPYPRVTWMSGRGVQGCPIDGSASRRVGVRAFPIDETAWIDALTAALRDGGCAAVICNTVARAQEVYVALAERFSAEELLLFHARYPFDDRMQRETAVLSNFGKDGDDARPYRMVCVATQVIEQSLDIDFDLLVTDLAPVDLVLQRTGRVWRHPQRARPTAMRRAESWLLLPPHSPEGVPLFSRAATAVYNAHVLLRSYLTLKDRTEVAIPEDVEDLVEAVYGPMDPPVGVTPALDAYWRDTADRLKNLELENEQMARRREIPRVGGDLMDRRPQGLDDEDDELHSAHLAMTRLGGPSVEVVCLCERDGELFVTPEVREPLDIHVRPDRDGIRRLLGRSLRIGFDAGLVKRIREWRVPPAWEVTAHLRRHRLLRFAPDGACLEDLPLKLDPVLGLLKTARVEEET